MRSACDELDAGILCEATCSPGGRLLVLDKAGSTQDVAKELAANGEKAWTAVMAMEQARGRGRCGHEWVSPTGKNLAMSVILRPYLPPRRAPLLSMLAAIAVANVLEAQGIPDLKLKWPNDVLVNNRKIAGILLEASITQDKLGEVILGLGVNINSHESDFPRHFPIPPISYQMCTGRAWDIKEAAKAFLSELKSLYERMEAQGFEFIPEQWSARWAHKNHSVTYEGGTATAVGISNEGFLILQKHGGSLVTVVSGDVYPVEDALSSACAQKEFRGKEVVEH